MLACEKRFERYLLDTPQKLVIGKEPNLHQHANLDFELKCHNANLLTNLCKVS